MEKDSRIINYVENCKVMLKDVFIPLIMVDLHHLVEVYVDYRKQQLLSI